MRAFFRWFSSRTFVLAGVFSLLVFVAVAITGGFVIGFGSFRIAGQWDSPRFSSAMPRPLPSSSPARLPVSASRSALAQARLR
jgi:hypothetical protein